MATTARAPCIARNAERDRSDGVGQWRAGHAEVAFDAAALPMAMAVLETAMQSIDIEMFLIAGEIGRRLMRLLDAKAREGVRVRLLYHEGASLVIGLRLKKLMLAFDPAAKAHPEHHFSPVVDEMLHGELDGSPISRASYPLRAFREGPRFLRLAHDKLIVVDRRAVVTGGMNIATAVANNHDALLLVTGAAVSGPAGVFDRDWSLATGEAMAVHTPQAPVDGGGMRLKFLVTRPGCSGHLDEVLALIDGARERLWLHMFYLTEPRIIQRLIGAHGRGVDVRIIVDPNEFSLGMHLYGAPNLGWIGDLLRAEVPVRYFHSAPGLQMHQKSMLIDAALLYTGATNFTRQSFLANTESAFVIESPALCEPFAERFLDDWTEASSAPDTGRLRRRRLYACAVRSVSRFL